MLWLALCCGTMIVCCAAVLGNLCSNINVWFSIVVCFRAVFSVVLSDTEFCVVCSLSYLWCVVLCSAVLRVVLCPVFY